MFYKIKHKIISTLCNFDWCMDIVKIKKDVKQSKNEFDNTCKFLEATLILELLVCILILLFQASLVYKGCLMKKCAFAID